MNDYNHYVKDVTNLKKIDIYRILSMYEVSNPAIQHAIKKLLVLGGRGHKDEMKDLVEARDSLNRAIEMIEENNPQFELSLTDSSDSDRKPFAVGGPIRGQNESVKLKVYTYGEDLFYSGQWYDVPEYWNTFPIEKVLVRVVLADGSESQSWAHDFDWERIPHERTIVKFMIL